MTKYFITAFHFLLRLWRFLFGGHVSENPIQELIDGVPHNRDHLTAIGLVCTYFAYVEWMVRHSLWSLAKLPPDSALIITNKMNFKTSLNMVRAFVSFDFNDSIKEYGEIAEALLALEDERNIVVHTYWQKGDAPDLVKAFDFKHGKNNKWMNASRSPEAIADLAKRIRDKGREYNRFMNARGVDTSWPRKPEKPSPAPPSDTPQNSP